MLEILSATPCWHVAAQAPPWHFEFANGRPLKIVWHSQAGRSYDLREGCGLQLWNSLAGFPHAAAYPFVAESCGFFQGIAVAGGGGWQLAQVPDPPAGSNFDLAALDADTAWAVGDGGTIVKTTDGAAGSWPAPAVAGVTPNVVGASASPQMTVTLSGSGFHGGNLAVAGGGTPAENVTWLNESTLQATAPVNPADTLDLSVTTADGQQAMLPQTVTFLPEPLVRSSSPLHARVAGSYQISVDGFNLESVISATFFGQGHSETLAVSVIDSTRVLVTVPPSLQRASGRVFSRADVPQGWHAAPGFRLQTAR